MDEARKELHLAVKEAYDAGLCIVPPREDGSKAPETYWKEFQEERASIEILRSAYRNGRCGLGVICGAVSGQLECLDFDTREIYALFKAACGLAGLDELLERMEAGYSEVTPNGYHLLYRPEKCGRCRKLARTETFETLIEVKAEGGYVIVAPTYGPVNKDGPYVRLSGSAATIPNITMDERDALHRVAETFDATPKVDGLPCYGPVEGAGDRVGDDFIRRGSWNFLGEAGWTKVADGCDSEGRPQEFWRRPGKDRGNSAILHPVSGLFYVFSTSTPFPVVPAAYNKFRSYAFLMHEGESRFRDARVALEAQGFRARSHVEAAEESGDYTWTTSWGWTRGAPARPTMLRRSDGEYLIYPGQAHSLVAPSEHLKSWMALHLAAEQVRLGQRVVYLDAEMDGYRIGDRLRSMGLGEDLLAQIHYHRVEDRAPAGDVEALVALDPAVVIIDGLNELLSLYGWNYSDTNEVLRLFKGVTRPFNRAGIATVTLDHPGHLVSDRAAGSQAKKSGIDVVYVLREVVRGSPVCRAVSAIQVAKDRDGWVRSKAIDGTHAGKIVVNPEEDGSVTTSIQSSFAGEFKAEKDPEFRRCAYLPCGEEFEVTNQRKTYCGNSCRVRDFKRKVAESDG